MQYPSSLKIGAHDYKLVFADSWEGCDGEMGETDYEQETIYIKKGLSDSATFQVVFHEIFHVINSKIDHVLLESLSEQFAQVLWDNGFVDET